MEGPHTGHPLLDPHKPRSHLGCLAVSKRRSRRVIFEVPTCFKQIYTFQHATHHIRAEMHSRIFVIALRQGLHYRVVSAVSACDFVIFQGPAAGITPKQRKARLKRTANDSEAPSSTPHYETSFAVYSAGVNEPEETNRRRVRLKFVRRRLLSSI